LVVHPAAVLLYAWTPATVSPPSFPTRRSSDLGSTAPISPLVSLRAALLRVTMTGRPAYHPEIAGMSPRCWRMRAMETFSPATPRSEEHTSELQSRENLVCRLLLEKKNKASIRR